MAQQQVAAGISVQTIYDITNRNYEWESFKYQVPRHYPSYNQKQLPPSGRPPHKLNYIDDVLKVKKSLPAPNKYTILDCSRPLSGKMDKNPRKTLADQIAHQSKREPSPGPASYFKRPKTAEVKANKYGGDFREHYLHEVEYLSAECPGVGEYNLNYFKGDHIASPKFNKPLSVSKSAALLKSSKTLKKGRREKEEGSQTLVAGTFDWIAAQKKQAGSKNFFGLSRRFAGESKFEKKPAPNLYKLNTKWTDSANVLKTSASTSTFKSVYYS